MQELVRIIPRKYRSAAAKILLLILCLGFILFLSQFDEPVSGAGRSDESHFRFDYDVIDEDLIYDVMLEEPEAVAPGPLRGKDLDELVDEIEKEENKTGIISEKEEIVYEYYNADELVPWFERPPSKPSDPGEDGKGVQITDKDPKIQELIKEGWNNHAFNHYVCEQISLHRSLADKRDKECKGKKWKKPMPTTSVIIIFHNEAWCALLRTVHSVLETSPKVALKEIILVDDASTNDDLGNKLDKYIKDLQIVKIIRMSKRSGLIRARLAGAEAASGQVLTFLDSHCECAPHWLEPLLERIAEDSSRVVSPVIEVIDAETFAMSLTSSRNVPQGAFGWGLEFHWATQPGNKEMHIQKKTRIDPFTTPVISGAVFSMEKGYFFQLGGFDRAMNGTGAENLELSMRVWMCGGSLEINPCSRVGHLGIRKKPHALLEEENASLWNKMVVAETWLGDYKWMFYKRIRKARELPLPDVTERLLLIDKLQCGNFRWYLENIYPDLYRVPFEDITLNGEIRCSIKNDICLDSNNIHGNPGSVVDISRCNGLGKGQYYEVTEQGEIRQNTISELCLAAHGSEVWTEKCRYPWDEVPNSQKWMVLSEGHIYHPDSNLCLTANLKKYSATLLKCLKQSANQLWLTEYIDGFDQDTYEFLLIESQIESVNKTDDGRNQ